MQEKKIYSLNVIAYLLARDIQIELKRDADNKIFAVVENDISDLLEEYKNNDFLQKFLHSYSMIRKRMKDINN